ncbi:MAG: hypothetical protein CMM47_04385 [Rhodospirillaceae bacterium]|nr:hypothetical protein [Rhodospirillaceae bacterium]
MIHYDKRGLATTAKTQYAVDAFDAAVDEFLGQGREATVIVGRLERLDSEMVIGQCLRGYFMKLGSRLHLEVMALDCLSRAKILADDANEQERKHVDALSFWCAGDLRRTKATWEEILIDHPLDILAFRLAHNLHFFVGDLAAMRDSPTRIMARWSDAVPGYGYLLGCRAFALEESGYALAGEPFGRRAVEMNEADIWAGHAVAHCLEAMGRRIDGITWITAHSEAWRMRGPFANQVWWHRSLHYLELESYQDVLDAFDTEFWPAPSEDNTDITNATSILMRLVMLGVDVENRWETIAEVCAGRVGDCLRSFNDLHFLMGLAMSDRYEEAGCIVERMRGFADENARKGTTSALVARDVGVPIAEAILAYAKRDYQGVIERMLLVRQHMVPLGGSWAQRDVWVRMLIDAARRGGEFNLARALLAERVSEQPTSAPSWKIYGDVLERVGETTHAATARARATALLAA